MSIVVLFRPGEIALQEELVQHLLNAWVFVPPWRRGDGTTLWKGSCGHLAHGRVSVVQRAGSAGIRVRGIQKPTKRCP